MYRVLELTFDNLRYYLEMSKCIVCYLMSSFVVRWQHFEYFCATLFLTSSVIGNFQASKVRRKETLAVYFLKA